MPPEGPARSFWSRGFNLGFPWILCHRLTLLPHILCNYCLPQLKCLTLVEWDAGHDVGTIALVFPQLFREGGLVDV
jgi:hypothetical protein